MPLTIPEPLSFLFSDNGIIPNSRYPVLLYRGAFHNGSNEVGDKAEEIFRLNNWFNYWRGGVYHFEHYHSNTHEVMGIYAGSALLRCGGENGETFNLHAGDIIVIPAGVGHQCMANSMDFAVLGAYPNGLEPDLKRGEKNERPLADKKISSVPLPEADPFMGRNGGLIKLWK